VAPAMALGVRQILLPLQGSNWRKAKPRNEVKWRSRGGVWRMPQITNYSQKWELERPNLQRQQQ
jgi:hypothetical protein